jgi:hypothetical protein
MHCTELEDEAPLGHIVAKGVDHSLITMPAVIHGEYYPHKQYSVANLSTAAKAIRRLVAPPRGCRHDAAVIVRPE